MLVVMKPSATDAEIERVVGVIRGQGLTPHVLPGATRTAIGVTGNTGAVDKALFVVLPGVGEAIRVTKAYKLASREMKPEATVVRTPFGDFGPGTFTVVAGPCSVENEAMIMTVAEFLAANGVKFLRAGAFKPRTSPYAFQGMGVEGLKILAKARDRFGLGIVTELMDTEYAAAVEEYADVIQIGTRNMQNFSLLKRVGLCRKPVLLKRGMCATLEEWLMAAEYVMAGGNYDVILCERGVRTFADHTRNTLDLAIVPSVKAASHLPIVVDPSHATGKRTYVPSMSLAALAAGADGIMVEAHPDPDRAMSDGAQSLDFPGLAALLGQVRQLRPAFGRV